MASSEREGAAGAGQEEEEEERSAAPEDGDGCEDLQPHPSSLLSRRTLDELGQLQDADPDNYKLHSSWAFWFERSPKGGSASDFFANLRQIYVVKTIKAFWCVFNNLSPVDQLRERESYHLMRDTERRPVWEDELNAHGGMWSFRVKKEDTAAVWQEVLLAAIGEQFLHNMDTGDDVCGVSVRIRGFDHNVIQIWNMDSEQHSKSSVIQRVKELIPSIEINEFYQCMCPLLPSLSILLSFPAVIT
ncbi:Eukaryotic translation initiation factor 4E type 3 [Geodia barretti]|uniref:Eukaryotic translation initiation factor 4E type 3 n=1 Tax=Geodia barretti TaxID=519541 RepID=A0AA35SI50_GEOBA|nr:Eukaryotic translation initiation factor 4E type 3 [Geodia barretti]